MLKEERNEAIRKMAHEDISIRKIAKKFNISHSRVQQILDPDLVERMQRKKLKK